MVKRLRSLLFYR